jgi:hypothetical protein
MNARPQERIPLPEITLADLESGCKAYAAARQELAQAIDALNADIDEAKRRHGAAIMAALAQHNTLREGLLQAVTDAPEAIFVKPRTYQFHGIKVGRQKAPGGLRFDNEDARTVELILEHFPDQAEVLVRTKKTPNREALEELTEEDLAKVGVRNVEAGDAVVCRAIATDLDKLIKALSGDSGLNEDAPA